MIKPRILKTNPRYQNYLNFLTIYCPAFWWGFSFINEEVFQCRTVVFIIYHNLLEVTIEQAEKAGYEPCEVCIGDNHN